MKAFGLGLLGIFIIGPVLAGLMYMSTYNGLVSADEKVSGSFAQVQNVMQRQADLIPNLVETVKGAAKHESSTLTAVIEARSALVKLIDQKSVTPEMLANSPELQKQLIEAQQKMNTQAMVSLRATQEAYPDLKVNKNFQDLMASIEGSQNRITVARRDNQLAVETYNRSLRTFPKTVVASFHGLKAKPYFAASEAAQTAPAVKF